MDELSIEQKFEAIKQDTTKTFTVTPCDLVYHFGHQRRSWYIAQDIINKLAEQELELSEDLYQAYFYSNLILKHKEVATTKIETDPVRKVDSLAAANHKPLSIDITNSLEQAITFMQQNDYSQLPVIRGGDEKDLCGYISWRTIGLALWHGKKGDTIENYISPFVTAIPRKTPLLDAIRMIATQEFVIVLKDDGTFAGIVTASDIAKEFFSITQAEAFLLLEQIELQIRILMGKAGILLEDVRKECDRAKFKINSLDDLSFGQYEHVLSNPKLWAKLKIKNCHEDFIKFMEEVRLIRNEIMHFEPDGIGEEKMQKLRNMARYLSEIASV